MIVMELRMAESLRCGIVGNGIIAKPAAIAIAPGAKRDASGRITRTAAERLFPTALRPIQLWGTTAAPIIFSPMDQETRAAFVRIDHWFELIQAEFVALRREMQEQKQALRAEMREQGQAICGELRAEMREQGQAICGELQRFGTRLEALERR
jgi:hypothetical protein